MVNKEQLRSEILDSLNKDRIGRSFGEAFGAVVGAIVGVGLAMFTGGASLLTLGAIAGAALGGAGVGASIGGLIDPPKVKNPTFGNGQNSPRYGFGPLQTMTSNELPVPIAYGIVKVAGSCLYQSNPATTVHKAIALCEGEIDSISDVRVNDIPIEELSGCNYTAYTGTSTQEVNTRFDGETVSFPHGLRYTAYMAMTLTVGSKLSGGNPNITCLVNGLKVKTWNGSSWSSTKTYSNNPAACIRDFLTSSRYGVGLPESSIDGVTFGEIYDWCNTQVVRGDGGGYENRATLNYIIDGRQSALDVLQDMLVTFGGFLVFSGNKIKLRVEGSGSVMQSFTMDTIIAGSFTYAKASKDELPNRIKLQYIDPNYNWAKIFVEMNDIVDQEKRNSLNLGEAIVTKEISAMGITGLNQATRMAKTYLYLSKICGTYVTFQVGPSALSAEVGDLINISHDVPQWTTKTFRILSIQHADGDRLQLYCREYNTSVYEDAGTMGMSVLSYGVPKKEDEPPDPPTSLVTTEGGYLSGSGSYIPTLLFSWTAPTDTTWIQHYFVEYSKNSGDYYSVGITTTSSIVLDNAEEGSVYKFRVRSVTYKGLYSDSAISNNYTVIGKSAPPDNVTGFSVSFTTDALLFTWYANDDLDLYGYEIREGTNWSTATILDTGITNTRYSYKPVLVGTRTYLIKAIDTSGNYSDIPDQDVITVTTAPDANITLDEDIFSEIQCNPDLTLGTFGNELSVEPTHGYDSSYNRPTLAIRTERSFGDYAVADPATKFLCHFDGGDGATSYTAETGQIITFVGTAQLDTAQSRFGVSSLLLDGDSDYVTIPDSDSWNFNTTDFTIEFSMKLNSTTGYMGIFSQTQAAGDDVNNMWECEYNVNTTTDHKMRFVSYSGGVAVCNIISSAAVIADTNWHHVAWTRKNGVSYLWIDGASKALTKTVEMGTLPDLTGALRLGCAWNKGNNFNGWIDEPRISKNIARYTSTFTPTTVPFSDSGARTFASMELETIGQPLANGIAVYTTSVRDLGAIYNALTTLTLTTSNTSVATYTTEIRYSTDNITWSAWGAWSSSAYYNFRYYQLRFTFYTSNYSQNFYIYGALLNVDVPDIWATDGGNGVAIGVGGTTITYQRSFSVPPRSLVVTTIDKSSSIVPVVSNQTASSFKCTLYDKTDTSVAGSVNFFAKGY